MRVLEPFPVVWHNAGFPSNNNYRSCQSLSHEESHLLLPADSAWLALERPENPMTITVMMRVDDLTPGRLRDFLEHYWLAWERFRFMPVQRPPGWWWEPDPTFTLDHHLEIVPGAFSESALRQWVSARLNHPLPDYRPRWKFWLVPDADGGSALLLRIHHCYADGLSLLGIFEQTCPSSPQQAPALYGAREQADLGRWKRSAGAWLDALVSNAGSADGDSSGKAGTSSLERLTHQGLRLVNELSQFLIEQEDTPSQLKRPLLGRRNCGWSQPVALDRFRSVAERTGCTINDVLLSCVAAAVRGCLEAEGDLLDESVMHAAVPVNIRDRMPEGICPDAGALGNFFGTVFVPLPVDGDTSLERLFRVKHETRRLKKSWQPGISWALAGTASLLPQGVLQTVAGMMYRKASAVVSNVPGLREHRFLAGCRIREQMFWVPQAGNIGLGISVISYAGQVQFGIVADEAILPDPEDFLSRCLDELDRFQL
ncbi:WS/DGAT domain-containing protein [Marinobacter zhejiangensis]